MAQKKAPVGKSPAATLVKTAAAKVVAKAAPKAKAKSVATPAVKPASKATAKKASSKAVLRTSVVNRKPGQNAGEVLTELKTLAKELTKAAQGLNVKKGSANTDPREVSTILGNVERMTAEAATKSLAEAESAKQISVKLLDTLGRDWARRDIENALREIGGHLTNIIVAQEFQDLAGQSLRKSIKALVGAIIITEGGGTNEEGRLSQNEVDNLLSNLM